MIRAILACDEEWGIGKDNTLPWPTNSEDLKWFRDNTVGSVVVMGRNTWESLPRKPLPKRNNVIVTSEARPTYGPYHFVRAEAYKETIRQMNALQAVWIIGGAQLIEESLDIIDEMWLTRIKGSFDCDVFLPEARITDLYDLSEVRIEGSLTIEIWKKK